VPGPPGSFRSLRACPHGDLWNAGLSLIPDLEAHWALSATRSHHGVLSRYRPNATGQKTQTEASKIVSKNEPFPFFTLAILGIFAIITENG
jgi:hypothetical protein